MRLFLIALLLWLPSFCAQAQLSFDEKAVLDFGKLRQPASGTEFVTLRIGGDRFTNNSTGTLISGDPTRGKYRIKYKGTPPSSTMTIDVIFYNSVSGLTIGNPIGKWGGYQIDSFPAGGLDLPPQNGTTLFLSPTATYNNNVQGGSFSQSFDIVVLFE